MQENTSKKYTSSLKQQLLLYIEQNTTEYSNKEFVRLICYFYLYCVQASSIIQSTYLLQFIPV